MPAPWLGDRPKPEPENSLEIGRERRRELRPKPGRSPPEFPGVARRGRVAELPAGLGRIGVPGFVPGGLASREMRRLPRAMR